MANKFQKGVLERLEQEASRSKKTAAPPKKEIPPAEPPTMEVTVSDTPPPVVAEPVVEKAPVIPEPVAQPASDDIRAYLQPSLQRQAKNKTFYLDGDVIAAIKSTAKAQKITDSKLVNDILRKVLGV